MLAETGKPLIQHTYEAAASSRLADQVVVATDHDEIRTAVEQFGGRAVMTSPDHLSGTARVSEVARSTLDESVCLFDFTRALHESLDVEQKHEVVRLLWKVAMADATLNKYEDYLVRKVADLLYVSHRDVIRIKLEVTGG